MVRWLNKFRRGLKVCITSQRRQSTTVTLCAHTPGGAVDVEFFRSKKAALDPNLGEWQAGRRGPGKTAKVSSNVVPGGTNTVP